MQCKSKIAGIVNEFQALREILQFAKKSLVFILGKQTPDRIEK